MKATKVFVAIALGSNVGDREGFLNRAIQSMSDDLLLDCKVSSFYETEPWGYLQQGKFLNAVMVGWTEWPPLAVLNYLKTLESDIGRIPTFKNGPREIDIDLILYGAERISVPGLQVPHPRFHEREFVLKPLAEVWPDWKKDTGL